MTDNLICLCGKRKRRPDAKPNGGACFPVLSQEEADVLCLLANGKGSSGIAHELSLSEATIKEHVKSLFYKARARSKPHLALTPAEQVRFLETTVAL
ncbi:DNA-binding NarL/FixJ family response regulator [Microvirga lupini]|uniref:DNA-binding NarL/FixJ family response regulator n=1 Tax=Microvirga lupini TaxID=420324 RepID=A0A7W4VQ83_9HYPH|nr:DNA-binding NarL/FixJ family response regulator [Microvirga lupini]